MFMKNRAVGMFEPPLVGPYEFLEYKKPDGLSVWLKDADGKVFDCATSHLVPYKENVSATVKRRRNMI